jgi:hypothetical protein
MEEVVFAAFLKEDQAVVMEMMLQEEVVAKMMEE